MKFIFLNACDGKIQEGVGQFLQAHSPDTDIFCIQEADGEMKRLGREALPGFQEVAAYKYISEQDFFLQATYVKDCLSVERSGTILENEAAAGLGLYVQVSFGSDHLHVGNVHGVAQPGNKLDDAVRLKQSQNLLNHFRDKHGPKIIGGDFNLLPETRSVTMFEEAGYRNLIKEFRIGTTRNRLAWELYPNSKQYFSDYVFVSPEVKVRSFSVPNLEISDHLPLILEIEQ